MNKIKVGIVGYGNLGKGVEKAIKQNPDFDLIGIFTRRNVKDIKTISDVKVLNTKDILDWKGKLDILILCGGSAIDLPIQGPDLLRHFNTIDSYDNHAKIPEYYAKMNQAGIAGGKLGLISIGWDPGLFSIMRLLFETILPKSHTETFWGPGVSQGHSEAIRKIPGVIDAIQYTIPIKEAIEKAEEGKTNLIAREKHLRECYVVIENEINKDEIEKSIKTMPNYFADYDTIVNFVSLTELKEKHNKMPHGGIVLTQGITDENTKQLMKFFLQLESNPEFTANVLLSCARATFKMAKEGKTGAITIFDLPLSYLSPKEESDLKKRLL